MLLPAFSAKAGIGNHSCATRVTETLLEEYPCSPMEARSLQEEDQAVEELAVWAFRGVPQQGCVLLARLLQC